MVEESAKLVVRASPSQSLLSTTGVFFYHSLKVLEKLLKGMFSSEKVVVWERKAFERPKMALLRFLRKYFDLRDDEYIDVVLLGWKKGLVQFFFDVVLNGFLINVALIPFLYFPNRWLLFLAFIVPFGVFAYLVKQFILFLKGRGGNVWKV